ncbi:MAG: hypothetical protein QNJ33_03430 [Crocosphaera sp.]|nr:hypothetical protein [Crocosphaera sp.]
MGNYHSDQPIQPEFEPHLGDLDPINTETLNADLLMDSGDNKTRESSQITEVSIVEDHDIPLTQDWFNLARKLRGQNRQLLDTIVTLEQALAASRQQLQDYQERSRHHNSLLSQQTDQLQTTQGENTHLLEQLQTSQTQLKQQQSDLESLQTKLQAAQEAFAHLEREFALLKEESLQNKHQLVLKEEQIRELQQRLQRQQRYALQYKSALDQCLSRHAKKIDAPQGKGQTTVDDQTSPHVVSIQPWSSSLENKLPPSLGSSSVELDCSDESLDPMDQTLEELFSLNPEPTLSVSENHDAPQEETPSDNPENSNPTEETTISSKGILVSSSVPFSFSIDPHRKEDAAREKVDLPSFLRRQ